MKVILPVIMLSLGCSFSLLSAASDSGLSVTHHARSLQPGEVIVMTVRGEAPLRQVEVTAFDQSFSFFPEGDGSVWKGLVGIDLNTRPGSYPAQIEALDSANKRLSSSYPLQVKAKEFPVRHLTVDPKFVTPPTEELERIRRESARISAIFASRTPRRLWRGSFLRPVPGEATSSFGKRSILNGKPRSPHTGTDFEAAQGTPVQAPNRGTVVLADDLYYSGRTVIIDHGQGLYSYFAHLSEFALSEGEKVKGGDVIGRVGATGRVTGPHLHWTLRLAETRVDPLSLLQALEQAGFEAQAVEGLKSGPLQ